MCYGYVRVSSRDQNINRQMSALKDEGLSQKYIFVDMVSGKDFERVAYQKLVRRLNPNEEVYIKAIDRLGRNYEEIIEQWHYLTKQKEIDIIVLDFPLLDTRNTIHGLTGQFISDLVLQILSYVAQIERENIRQRQAEGIKVAQKKGIQFGRPKLEVPENFSEVAEQWQTGSISLREGAILLNTNHTTFSRWLKRYGITKK